MGSVTRLVCVAVASAHAFTARNIANALWALAKMMHNPGDTFLNTMGAEVAKKVADFNAQNHANTVWAFATLGMCSVGFASHEVASVLCVCRWFVHSCSCYYMPAAVAVSLAASHLTA